MKRAAPSPLLMLKRLAVMAAATIYLTGCGLEIVDVTAPPSVTGGQPFEIEVTQQFFNAGSLLDEAESEFQLVFVLVVPEDWSPRAGGSYDAEFDGVPVSLSVEVLSTIESGWNHVLYDPESGSPCLPEYAEDESAQEACAQYKALDAVEFVPFFYGGPYPPPDVTTYQLLYVRTELMPEIPYVADDTGVLTLPFVAGAIQPAEEIPFIASLAMQVNLTAAQAIGERLAADQQQRWPIGAPQTKTHEESQTFVWWVPSPGMGSAQIDGYEVPIASSEEAVVRQFAAQVPVPVGGPALFALIALGLVGLGISAGRKRKRKI